MAHGGIRDKEFLSDLGHIERVENEVGDPDPVVFGMDIHENIMTKRSGM